MIRGTRKPSLLSLVTVCLTAVIISLLHPPHIRAMSSGESQQVPIDSHLPPASSFSSNSSTPSPPLPSSLVLTPRRSYDRGHGNHHWLNSRHTFSFARYYDPRFIEFSQLRVINEDRVTGGNGFGRHTHEDAEIFSYIVSGQLKHDDSLGNTEMLRRGDVQFTSAGSGIAHSEFNGHPMEMVHFLQVWLTPHTEGLTPTYHTAHWTDEDKQGKLALIVSSNGVKHSIPTNAEVRVYASLLKEGETVSLPILPGRRAYVHVVMDVVGYDKEKRETSVEVNAGQGTLLDGDGCFVELADARQAGVLTLTGHSKGSKAAEMLVFDLTAGRDSQ